MTTEQFQEFINDEMKPRTAEFVKSHVTKTKFKNVKTFYYDVMIGLGMSVAPLPDENIKQLEAHNNNIDATKRYFLKRFIDEIKLK
ncbi:MAG: hypothetical protein ACOYMA_22675 [Bacteroidia bacterium]